MASAMNMDELEKEGKCDARGRCPSLKSQELEVVGSNAGSEDDADTSILVEPTNLER